MEPCMHSYFLNTSLISGLVFDVIPIKVGRGSVFKCTVEVDGRKFSAEGKSKKESKQNVAAVALP